MRLIVVGNTRARHDLREQLETSPLDVVGEFESLADARESGIAADAIVLSSSRGRINDGEEVLEALTRREVTVLELVAEGLPNKQIADRLGISDQTVKFHLASIMSKLAAANRTDAVRRAVRAGLVTL